MREREGRRFLGSMLLYIISYFMVGCGMETSDLIVQ